METYSSCTKVLCLMAHSPLRSLPELLGMSRIAVAVKYSTVQRNGGRWLVQAIVRSMEEAFSAGEGIWIIADTRSRMRRTAAAAYNGKCKSLAETLGTAKEHMRYNAWPPSSRVRLRDECRSPRAAEEGSIPINFEAEHSWRMEAARQPCEDGA
jgi:hypothetical protein